MRSVTTRSRRSRVTLEPRPRAPSRRPLRARSSAAAPIATSHAAIPFDLKTTMSRRTAGPELARDDLLQLVHLEPVEHAARHRLDQVARLELRLLAASRSRRTPRARGRRCRARARSGRWRRPRRRARPACSHSPRRTGSREVVTVTTTSCAAASGGLSAGSAPVRSQNARERSPACGSRRRRARSTGRRTDRGDLRLGLAAAADHAERACARRARGASPRRRSRRPSGGGRAGRPRSRRRGSPRSSVEEERRRTRRSPPTTRRTPSARRSRARCRPRP